MAKNKNFNIEQYLKLTNGLRGQEYNDNDFNVLSKLIGEIRNQMFGQKSEELYKNAQRYYDAERALELMENNNEITVTFDNVLGISVTLTKNEANKIKTKVEQSVQAIEIKKELINSLWQKFEQDKSHAPKIYSENALNEVLEYLGYEAKDLVLPQFNNLPNAQAQAPAYNYVDRDDEDALDSLSNARVQRPMHNDFNEQDAFGTTMDIYNREVARGGFAGGFNDAHVGNHQFNNFRDDEDEDALDSLSNARFQRPIHNDFNDFNEQDEFGTMAIYNREVARGGFAGGFNDAHVGNHQFNNFRDDEDEDVLDSLSNARAQRPMHNDLNEQDEFGTMAIYKRGVEQGGFGGDFNDARAGNHQLDTFNAEQGNAFNSLDHTQANYFLKEMKLLFRPIPAHLHQFKKHCESKFLEYYTYGNISSIQSIIDSECMLEYRAKITQQIISLRNSCFNDQSFHHPKQKPVVEETPLISGMAGIQLQQSPVPKARTSLAQSKPQESAITQPRNSDEEVKKINKWLEDNKLPTLSSYSTILLKKYYQDPSQKDYLGNICVQQSLFGQDRQKLISLITGASIVREKFLLELDKNELKVSSSTENAIMQFLSVGKSLNWSSINEEPLVQIFIEQELCKYQALKNTGKAREYTMDYKAWQHANETTTNIAARAATDKVQAEKVAEKAKIQQLLKEYPNTKPVFEQLQKLNLAYSQIDRVVKKINEFLNNPNSNKDTFNAELSTALLSNYSDDEFNLVNKIFTATISYKERYDHNGNAGYYYDHDDYTINLLGEEGI
ncbi:hypothetical protein [Candidatus Tisiphia endosymbiont of Thecophora atra]|uniref:hypothetical protein n=1 Tax=Candidatus Tisiphia endosymbiont of Thecophora atra TaxID=3066258 RepID=UPI00312C6D89